MKRKIKTADVISKTRRTWNINPNTRVHNNDSRKNKKKDRQAAKSQLKEYMD